MWVHILGSAAGGGFPQWNCNCQNCRGVRHGSQGWRRRTQSSIAVSTNRHQWFLFNASPDIPSQIESLAPIFPEGETRYTPIRAVVLSDSELDHTLGLLLLRVTHSVRIYATEWVYKALQEWNPVLRTLNAYCKVDWQRVTLGQIMILSGPDFVDSGLRFEAFSTFSTKTPVFSAERAAHPECTVGYRISDLRNGGVLVYIPTIQELSPEVEAQLKGCAVLLFDGTFWDDDELVRLGIGSRTARAMGHLPIGSAGGSLEQLARLDIKRKIYIHINNTNPILNERSVQRRAIEVHSLEVAVDGMEMEV